MLKLGMTVPRNVIVAVSGGADSMAALSFLSNRPHPAEAAYFNHGTAHGAEAETFVRKYCESRGIVLHVGRIKSQKMPGISPEEHWRNARYEWLESLGKTIVTAHHLGDCVEQWIFSALHGKPAVIPPTRNCVIRPFLLTAKADFEDWCTRHSVPWITDPSNADTKYMRNKIRQDLMPHALAVNPGLPKVVAKIVSAGYKTQRSV